MPRIPYMSNEMTGPIPEAMKNRRGGELLDLDRMLLHNVEIASGWNALLNAIRTKTTSLSDSEREIAICWVAVLNRAEYEWTQHVTLAIGAGIPEPVMTQIKSGNLDGLSPRHRLILELTSSMTLHVDVPPQLFDLVKEELGEEGVHELVATVATYNMVSRYLVALQVGR